MASDSDFFCQRERFSPPGDKKEIIFWTLFDRNVGCWPQQKNVPDIFWERKRCLNKFLLFSCWGPIWLQVKTILRAEEWLTMGQTWASVFEACWDAWKQNLFGSENKAKHFRTSTSETLYNFSLLTSVMRHKNFRGAINWVAPLAPEWHVW